MNRIVMGKPATTEPPPHSTREVHPDREPAKEVKAEVKRRDGYRCLCCGCGNERQLQVDHIVPAYHGGANDPENLQTLCEICNAAKGVDTIDFRSNRTGLKEPGAALPDVGMPSEDDANEPSQWDFFLRHTINAFFRCGAVDSVEIGQRGKRLKDWDVQLFPGNSPDWLKPHLADLIAAIREFREDAGFRPAPDFIRVSESGPTHKSERTLPDAALPRTSYVIDNNPLEPDFEDDCSEPQGPRLEVEEIGKIAVIRFVDKKILAEQCIQLIGDGLNELVDKGHHQMLFSFQNVDFLSSAALGKLISLHRKLSAHRGKLVICCLHKDIHDVFKLCKLDQLLTLKPDEQSGLKAF